MRRRVREMERNSIIREARRGLASSASVGGIGGASTLDGLTDVNAPAPSNGDVLTWDSTPGEWVPQAPTSGGGSSSDDPIDTPPTAPSAYDDEFDGTVLDAKWTHNPLVTANPLSITVSNGRLILAPNNYALNARLYGIAQDLAGGVTSFKIWGKFSSPLPGTDHYAGLIVGVSGGAGKGHVFGIGPNGANAFLSNMGGTYNEGASDWSGYDGYNNAASPTGFGPRHVGWHRIRWDAAGTTLYFDYSTDGDQWVNWTSRGGMSQPDRIGVGMYAQGNPAWTTGVRLNARYFRFEANATF